MRQNHVEVQPPQQDAQHRACLMHEQYRRGLQRELASWCGGPAPIIPEPYASHQGVDVVAQVDMQERCLGQESVSIAANPSLHLHCCLFPKKKQHDKEGQL